MLQRLLTACLTPKRARSVAGALGLLVAVSSIAAADPLCWECERSQVGPGQYFYRCVQVYISGTASVSCWDNGGGSGEPCVMGGPCSPILTETVSTVRPDGVMTPFANLAQLLGSNLFLQSRNPLVTATYTMSFAAADERQRLAQLSTAATTLPIAGLFVAAAMNEVETAQKCEGYLVVRAYSTEKAGALRRDAAVLTI